MQGHVRMHLEASLTSLDTGLGVEWKREGDQPACGCCPEHRGAAVGAEAAAGVGQHWRRCGLWWPWALVVLGCLGTGEWDV